MKYFAIGDADDGILDYALGRNEIAIAKTARL
jgi:hypothetical protein